ncbi:putative solute-binding protein [Alkanindiges sp. WGS2144]|uniref:putative solute-binding protein n=1 Tax=Alkanindiges sp. WGS2144 TaxID=3366808 RepID=UPI0037515B32
MYKTIRNITTTGLLLGAVAITTASQAQTICVFDLGGASGDNFALMRDYALSAKKWGVTIDLKAYNSEGEAINDFKKDVCDGVAATSFSTRPFNSYTGSINAIGAIPSNVIARNLLSLMGSPKVARDMVEGEYEAAGVIPLGAAYFLVKDRSINSLAKAEGKRIGVLQVDPVQYRMAQKVGAKPVYMIIDNAGQKFQNNEIDVLPAPAFAYSALEVYRSMGANGGIARFPISFMTGQLILKKDKFPAGYGQKSRSWFASQTSRLMNQIGRYEAAVPAKYWFDISSEDKVGYLRLMRQMRIEFVQNKTYNPKMMSLLKKLRCQQDATSFECSLKGE